MNFKYLILIFLISCQKDIREFFIHPLTNFRVGQSLSESITKPSDLFPQKTHFKFIAFGDPQSQSDGKNNLSKLKTQIQDQNIDLMVVLGDLTEDGTFAEFQTVKTELDSFAIPYLTTIGNHDLYNKNSWDQWLTLFGSSTYTVTAGDSVQFFMLDTSSGELGSKQFIFLETELKKSTRPIKIVGTHYPIYDGPFPLIWRLNSYNERVKLLSILSEYKVQYYLSGHNHGYYRSLMNELHHIIIGSMYPGALDYGKPGFMLFEVNGETVNSEFIEGTW